MSPGRLGVLKVMVPATVLVGLALGAASLARVQHGAQEPRSRVTTDALDIRFEEVAAQSGIRYAWNPRPHRPLRNRDAFGCGCAFLDYDNDDHQDVLLVGAPQCGLFHNDGHGRFADVTASIGLKRLTADWTGCAVGDYDGDGWPDLLLTGYHRLALLRNHRGGAFQEVTEPAGLSAGNWANWGSSAGFMDLDRDGDLDLVLLNYVIMGQGEPEYCEMVPGVKSGCPPQRYRGEYGRVLRNNGNASFTDITRGSGFDSTHGKGLVLCFFDADEDGLIDFYVGNDGTPADFMKNLGGMRFRNVSLQNGTMYTGNPPHSIAGMGADCADYDKDGRLDFAVSAFSSESYPVFHNDGRGMFTNTSDTVGVAGPTLLPLGFGAKFADVENDGWPDLVFANGHVYDRISEIRPGQTFRQPMMLFHNDNGRRFSDLVPAMGGAMASPILGRGMAAGDVDDDGRMDLLVVDLEGSPLLLRNQTSTLNHWLTVKCRSGGKNDLAYGAHLRLTARGETWLGVVSPASSYLSSSDPRVHFGLGRTDRPDSLEVRWPSGKVETIASPPVDRILTIVEGRGIAPPKK